MRIAIIGGSISSLAALKLLLEQGHEVTVFEQHPHSLDDQGAGITITPELFATLKNHHIFDQDQTIVHIGSRTILCNNHHQTEIICEQKFSAHALHWQTLYTKLKAAVPHDNIKSGHRVLKIDGKTLTTLHQGKESQQTFDLIIGADGYHSLTAKHICGEI
ncbi:MAG TPA: NAD(P)-binding protein, partial [Gammaproteobacteria bacterium]|nr:NAD(P)-binding protein [Gammaproteobacteria bacterium]